MLLTHTIQDEIDLQDKIEMLDLKPASSLQTICLGLMQAAETEGEEVIYIKIANHLMADSYTFNPPMFARSVQRKSPYPSVQSYLEDNLIVLRAGQIRKPRTFSARALAAINRRGVFKIKRKLVPPSYRRRPGMLSSFLNKETESQISNRIKGKIMIWEITPSSDWLYSLIYIH